MVKDIKTRIREKTKLSDTAISIVFDMDSEITPGQFITVGCGAERILRRPLSVCDAVNGRVRVVFEARGEGTAWLASREPGEILNVLGPLGNGFRLQSDGLPALFIGGGIGAPPVLFSAKRFVDGGDAVIGFKSKKFVILEREFREAGKTVSVCTDDGSYGVKGFVTSEAERLLKKKRYGRVISCGPTLMLREIAKLAASYKVPCQVSLEERMGCGVGACLVCACKIKGKDGDEYRRVCKDGPVFDAGEVLF
ncbi:MAG: dihydroorotate dehydrogenase electron transfer subunit [Bacillota bacterium]|nr:dihydroorotate dehydrogenase electron transfer subunit [Bacillota bacterium]